MHACVAAVCDPELPALTIAELGILRGVREAPDGGIVVALTPTYSGCPATQAITDGVRQALDSAGHRAVRIEIELAPAWTTACLTPSAHAKLRAAGIAPPQAREADGVPCPHCGAPTSALVSWFGSTACKALYRCTACHEPFEYFKCL